MPTAGMTWYKMTVMDKASNASFWKPNQLFVTVTHVSQCDFTVFFHKLLMNVFTLDPVNVQICCFCARRNVENIFLQFHGCRTLPILAWMKAPKVG